MEEQKFRLILTGEAQDFLESLSLAVRKKIHTIFVVLWAVK